MNKWLLVIIVTVLALSVCLLMANPPMGISFVGGQLVVKIYNDVKNASR